MTSRAKAVDTLSTPKMSPVFQGQSATYAVKARNMEGDTPHVDAERSRRERP